MNIDSIQNGIVIDHISAGKGHEAGASAGAGYSDLSVAIIKNVHSQKMGKRTSSKIDADIPVNLDVIGYVDPEATVNVIRNGDWPRKRRICTAEDTHQCHLLQKSPLHHIGGTGNPACVPSDKGRIPLHLL